MSNRDRNRDSRQFRRQHTPAPMPERLPLPEGVRMIKVFVEGYEDVAFWRGIFDDYETKDLRFEIDVPPRPDLAKGKRVLISMLPECCDDMLLCVDSDFDYLFNGYTDQSRMINESPYMFHTYAYATENYLCYAPSLHNVCVKATKNDLRIFDFEKFMQEYSRTIYPLFLWYAASARADTPNIFTLIDFKGSVKLNYLEVHNNGEGTLQWLEKQVVRRLESLEKQHPHWAGNLPSFEKQLHAHGVTPDNVYLFMQGHTLMDNVVIVMLNAVCEYLKMITTYKISASTKQGIALRNEQSNYNNALRNVRDILLDNENYKDCFLYRRLKADIDKFVKTSL